MALRGSVLSNIPWQPILGSSLMGIAIVAFGGFYLAGQRARVAIMASFVLTFLCLFITTLTIPSLGSSDDPATTDIREMSQMVEALLDQFKFILATVITFYFGSEAVIAVSKIRAEGQSGSSSADIRKSDTDLAAPTSKPSI